MIGKVQKMGVLYIHFSKILGPYPNFHKYKIKKIKKLEKGRLQRLARNLTDYRPRPASD
jgi:hypothetical protein